MKVAIIIGSIRIGRQSHKVGLYLEKKLRERSIAVDLIDLAENPLPMLEERVGMPSDLFKTVQQISERLNHADALLLVTPEYHGSFSGVLKNALDYYWEEFNKKPIGVITVSNGKFGGINASTQLQHVILSLGAFALPTKLLIPEVHLAFNDLYQPRNKKIVQNTKQFLDEFTWFAEAIAHAKSPSEKRAA